MSEIKLKPCPFCGKDPMISRSIRYPRYGRYAGKGVEAYSVVCDNYDCLIYWADDKYFYSEKLAARVWNRRCRNEQNP